MKNAGIVLIALGIILLIFTGFSYVTHKKVADIGPVEINKKENHTVNWTPMAGAVLLIGGVLILSTSKNKIS